VMERTRP